MVVGRKKKKCHREKLLLFFFYPCYQAISQECRTKTQLHDHNGLELEIMLKEILTYTVGVYLYFGLKFSYYRERTNKVKGNRGKLEMLT